MPQALAVKVMFNRVSKSYDLLNDILSLGIHRIWKNRLINELLKDSPKTILDCATGTGDIALWTYQKSKNIQITGIDFSAGMLEIAKKKSTNIDWQIQDIMNLDFQDNEFEVSTISYGIRNVENLERGLSELSRVTEKKLCILEFGAPENKVFRTLYFGVMKIFMPFIGLLFGKKNDYQYLIESSQKFPAGKDFVSILKEQTKFKKITYKPFFGGVTYLYTAEV